jgi:transcriptional regulator with XRE-family HTH domain
MRYKTAMTRTTKKTTIAVLRSITGLKAKCFADVLGCSEATVNSLETGRLKLSETMAQRIFHETGASLKWLLAGDVHALPMGRDGKPYSAEHFEAHHSHKLHADKLPPARLAVDFVNFAARLHDILSASNRADGYALTAYKVGRFLDGMERDGGAPASDWPAMREAMLTDIAQADAWFAELGERGTGGQDVVTKKAAPTKARPRSVKRKG